MLKAERLAEVLEKKRGGHDHVIWGGQKVGHGPFNCKEGHQQQWRGKSSRKKRKGGEPNPFALGKRTRLLNKKRQ